MLEKIKLAITIRDLISKINKNFESVESEVQQSFETLDTKIDGINANLTQRIDETQEDVNEKYHELLKDIDDLTDVVEEDYATLNSKIDTTTQTINQRITDVADELNQTIEENVVALQQEDTALQNQINTHSQQITQEINDRINSDNTLNDRITSVEEDINKSISELETKIDTVEDNSIVKIDYDSSTQEITYMYGDEETETIPLKNLITNVSYNGSTGDFTFDVANGTSKVINTPVENFLSDVTYDPITKKITFKMVSGQTFEVDIHDLVDVYTVDDTDTISMNISGNIITSNVKISEDKDNLIELKDDGLFVQKYKAGEGISIENNIISNLNTSAEWGNITGSISNQLDLKMILDSKITYTELGEIIIDIPEHIILQAKWEDTDDEPVEEVEGPVEILKIGNLRNSRYIILD